tara:strand:- start:925 stop:1743 length:819 start_codon:yes stop_codon:yes gene_type:complete
MRRGNLSKDRSSFTWKAEQGIRKTHKLGKHDIFVQVSISGDEFVVQQQGRPEQFLVINSASLDKYLKKHTSRGANVYMSIEALRSLPHSLGDLEDNLNIVYPAYTRFDTPQAAKHSKDAESSSRQTSGASSSDSPSGKSRARVQDLDDEDEEEEDIPQSKPNTVPPKGLYVWMEENQIMLFNLLCNSEKLNQYLRQSSSVCTPAQHNILLSANKCQQGDTISKCVRRLLSHVHPDKLNADMRACGQDLFQKISEAYADLKARDSFDINQQCH